MSSSTSRPKCTMEYIAAGTQNDSTTRGSTLGICVDLSPSANSTASRAAQTAVAITCSRMASISATAGTVGSRRTWGGCISSLRMRFASWPQTPPVSMAANQPMWLMRNSRPCWSWVPRPIRPPRPDERKSSRIRCRCGLSSNSSITTGFASCPMCCRRPASVTLSKLTTKLPSRPPKSGINTRWISVVLPLVLAPLIATRGRQVQAA